MAELGQRISENFHGFLDLLIERNLLIDSNPLLLIKSIKGTNLTWSTSTGLSYLFTDYASIDQYVEILNRRDFNFCLYDGGLIQIEYFIKDDEIFKHRLCYIPCPFSYDPLSWEGIALSDIPSMMSASDLLKDARLTSPIRFDFDAEFSDEKHAFSHLTLNKSSCRVPAYGPISLGHFFRFILRYFYEVEFDLGLGWEEFRPKLYSRTLIHPSPHEMHIESAIGFE